MGQLQSEDDCISLVLIRTFNWFLCLCYLSKLFTIIVGEELCISMV